MFDLPLLTILTFAPLVGVVAILIIRHDDAEVVATNARNVALFVSSGIFILSLMLWFTFDRSTADFQWVEKIAWMEDFGIEYHMGVDGISVLFVLLTALPDADLHPCQLGRRSGNASKRIHGRLPVHGSAA